LECCASTDASAGDRPHRPRRDRGDGFAAFRDFDDDGHRDTPIQDILDDGSDGHEGYIALAKPGDDDPKTQAEAYARDREGWRASEQKEIENHTRNGSWELVERSSVPRGRSLIKLIWVYKVKRDGTLKSRLCVQGCRQVQGVDYQQTWCGTMRGTSLRLLSAVAAKSNMRMRRWDFVAAYLQGQLLEGEVVYCLPPPGEGYATIGKDGLPMVCKIVKPVYGTVWPRPAGVGNAPFTRGSRNMVSLNSRRTAAFLR